MTERMSDVEALMWLLEKDPHLSSTFANVTVFDQMPDIDVLRRRMQGALIAVPRLGQRVSTTFARFSTPTWIEHPEIDLDWHVRHVELGSPGTDRQLFDLAATLAREPFDPTRPLWRFTLIDGLSEGRAAMVQQMHHTITDGEGGLRMSMAFLDFTRNGPEPELPVAPLQTPTDEPTIERRLQDVRASAEQLLRRGFGLGRRSVDEVLDTLRNPSQVPEVATDIAEVLKSLGRQLVVSGDALSPLWRERTLERSLHVTKIPLDQVRAAAGALGGSVNDVFVTAIAGGAGRYHRHHGVAQDQLRMAMPISTREKGDRSGNAFLPTRSVVSTVDNPRQRFVAIHATLHETKSEPALAVAQSFAGLLAVLPTSVLIRTARQQVETIDFTTSNLRGAPFDIFIGGAKVEANYPLGPVAGTAFNATVLSVSGSLDLGIHIDTGAVQFPEELSTCIAESFSELLSLG